MHTIAVGSADVQSRSKRVTVKNTFLEIAEGSADTQAPAAKNRSNSVPRSLKLSGIALESRKSACEVLCSYRTASSGQGEISDGCSMVPVVPPLQETSDSAPDQQLDYPATPCSLQQVASSELQDTSPDGLASIGSALHATCNCTPCLFHSRALYEGGSPCWKGSSCERCHEDHGKQERRKPATGRARARLKKQRQEDEIPCLD